MSATRNQKRNEQYAALCDEIAGGKSEGGRRMREVNRQIEKRKRRQFRSKP